MQESEHDTIAHLRQQVLDLESKLSELKHQIRFKDETLQQKNLALDAYHHVWCSGGCESGIHRYHDTPLTEEIVKEAEINTRRLREKFNNLSFKVAWAKLPSEEKSKIDHECFVAKTRDWQDAAREVRERYVDSATVNVLERKRQA